MAIANEPLLTDLFEQANDFSPSKGSAYLYGQSVEQRSEHATKLIRESATFLEVMREEGAEVYVKLIEAEQRLLLRSERQLDAFWHGVNTESVYIDITGLSHHVWAPLLRSALRMKPDVMVVYLEPMNYRFDPAPTEGQIFDLSERIRGLAPLPGFAWLSASRDEDALFIPLLGFEGRRLAYLLEQVQPSNDRIVPIVGVPGFRPEYPFHTYLGTGVRYMRPGPGNASNTFLQVALLVYSIS